MRTRSEWPGNPEYGQLLFGHDGVERERLRLQRGFAVISSHPFWFASVMLRRAIASTRLIPFRSWSAARMGPTYLQDRLFLPLIVIGLVIMIRRREWQTLAIILTYRLLHAGTIRFTLNVATYVPALFFLSPRL